MAAVRVRKAADAAYYKANRDRIRDRQAKYYLVNKPKVASYQRKHAYGVSDEEYQALLLAQRGVCAICGTDQPGKGKRSFSVDHDHKTGAVRGLLCSACNVGIGFFQDSVELLRKAAAYVVGNGV